METYIIDPSVFYWINVLSIIQTVLAVVGTFATIAGLGLLICYIFESNDVFEPKKPPEDANQYEINEYTHDLERYNKKVISLRRLRKWFIPLLILGIVCIITSVFIPGKTTSVEMLVAKTATFENVDWSVQQVKEIIDYITSALKGAV